MNENQPTGEVVKVYVTDKPRILGIFHVGPTGDGTPGATQHAGYVGLIGQIGPCRCGDPSHTFPRWYSLTPCVYVRANGFIVTCRIPGVVARALLWFSSNA